MALFISFPTYYGPCFIAEELKRYLAQQAISYIRTKTYHPMTQGKIERYHRSMKNLILLDLYYSPEELSKRIGEWVGYYNNIRYHEAIDNVTPRDKYFGRDQEILERRKKIKAETLRMRRHMNQKALIQVF
jgi:transposase InsO family protein